VLAGNVEPQEDVLMMNTYETEKQFIDISSVNFSGRILDVGGGGEGVISRKAGDIVVAIDRREEELIETPDVGLKIIMDACNLKFLSNSFENITAFYTLMYMNEQEVQLFLQEAYRVLKIGGLLWIWDITLPSHAAADIFVAQLDIKLSDELHISTGYGVAWNREQTIDTVRKSCENIGFITEFSENINQSFSLRLQKYK